MAFRHPFFEFDPFEEILFNAFKAEPEHRAVTGKTDSTIFPRYRAVSDHNAMVLEVELPGVDKNTLQLDVNRKHITLAAKRPILTSSFGKQAVKDTSSSISPDGGAQAQKINAAENTTNGADASAETAVAEVKTDDNSLKYAAKFRLGYDVDVDEVKAEFDAGILRIRVPRHETSAQSRRVQISGMND
jgi:HSP20 family molecular chaperone IbpA